MRQEEKRKIAGVDADIIERFLLLLKDKYALVDKANYFLESQGVSGINIGMANQRDVLSHLCTILDRPELTYDEQVGQLASAEEHLRRAILESYQKGCTKKLSDFMDTYKQYETIVLPLKTQDVSLTSAPSMESLHVRLEEVQKLRSAGRAAKAQNKWDNEWETGVVSLVEAFNIVVEMQRDIEGYIIRAQQILSSRHQKVWGHVGLWATIVMTFIGVVLGYFIAKVDPFQRKEVTKPIMETQGAKPALPQEKDLQKK
ncbi:MAG: hypothetical protein WC156_14630 [Pedobacter sp.]